MVDCLDAGDGVCGGIIDELCRLGLQQVGPAKCLEIFIHAVEVGGDGGLIVHDVVGQILILGQVDIGGGKAGLGLCKSIPVLINEPVERLARALNVEPHNVLLGVALGVSKPGPQHDVGIGIILAAVMLLFELRRVDKEPLGGQRRGAAVLAGLVNSKHFCAAFGCRDGCGSAAAAHSDHQHIGLKGLGGGGLFRGFFEDRNGCLVRAAGLKCLDERILSRHFDCGGGHGRTGDRVNGDRLRFNHAGDHHIPHRPQQRQCLGGVYLVNGNGGDGILGDGHSYLDRLARLVADCGALICTGRHFGGRCGTLFALCLGDTISGG
ncbi:hypothetical protein SDC9_98627 [bioreactor metagenome]|uniref:Uncharacterized protein n=1 Tax=bioreactor metagenome TaxID=1076179 RepID=A0A645AFZ7_9ZZZZ